MLTPSAESNSNARPASWSVLFLLVGAVLGVGVLSSSMFTGDGAGRIAAAFFLIIRDGVIVLAWLAAAVGFGGLAVRLLARHAKHQNVLRVGLGVCLLLWLDHALGMAGALQWGAWIGGWGLCAVGWLLLLIDLAPHLKRASQEQINLPDVPWLIVLALPAIAVLITASLSAPGYLWSSEAHGYDVLEYHLQLPREWLALGHIASLQHNVYSFAGSYVEAAYYHLAVLADPLASSPFDGSLHTATAAQLLHAAMALITASLLFVFGSDSIGRRGAGVAAALYLALPWTVVTGSMAYNEQAMVLALVVGFSIINDANLAPGRRGLLIGLVGGVACGAKLTALGFVAFPLAIVLLVRTKPRWWWRVILLGVVGALIAYGPVLIRNGIATNGENPLFPLAFSLLGSAHWNAEQAARWNAAHAFDGSLLDRLHRFVEMGVLHRQWAGMWIIGVAGLVLLFIRRRCCAAVVNLLIILGIQVAFWFFFTHLQSRFLIPCAVPLVLFIGGALAGREDGVSDASPTILARFARGFSGVLVVAISLWAVLIYSTERQGAPSAAIDGVSFQTGEYINTIADPQERMAALTQNPWAFLNSETNPDDGLYLLGDATPFYLLRPVTYHTTYDTSPLGEAIRATPDDPAAWAAALYAQDIRLIMVNYDELARLVEIDHWYDPDVTIDNVNKMLAANGAVMVMPWEIPGGRGRALYRLHPAK